MSVFIARGGALFLPYFRRRGGRFGRWVEEEKVGQGSAGVVVAFSLSSLQQDARSAV
jgi:hypothetical protein